MQNDNINLNKPVVKSESGLFLDPSLAMKSKQDTVLEKYNERYLKALNAPTPNIRVAYSYVLTRAVPPKMKGTTAAGLILNELDVDVRMMKKLEIMTENVNDEQEVLAVGHLVPAEVVVPGETIKIDFRRYRTLNDDHTAGVIQTSYEIPLYEINGHEYMLLDSRDIIYTVQKETENNEVTNE